jgi:kinesin family protein 5
VSPTKQITSPTPTAATIEALTRSNSPTFEKLPEDERETFLKRENELTDQIAEKETEISNLQKQMDDVKQELVLVKEEDKTLKEDNKNMSIELVEIKMQMDKIHYESKETSITLDSLNEQNLELQKELDALKIELLNVKQNQREIEEQDKQKKKSEKMAQMMAGLDTSEINAKEKAIRDTLHSLESMNGDGGLSNAEADALRRELSEARTLMEQQETTITDLHQENELLTRKRDEIEVRLNALEIEYEDLLDKTIAEEETNGNIDLAETIQDLKSKIEMQYASKRESQQKELDELKDIIERKNDEIAKLNTSSAELRRANEDLEASIKKAENMTVTRAGMSSKDLMDREKEMERIKKTMAQQLADFDTMRKSLMRDLQSRCEQVVELEISLDTVREQYNNALRNANSKVQAKKMAFLERNLEQLTLVQKQLVEQNAQLKKDFAIAERKLAAKNERIQSLEQLLQDAQNKLQTQNQKFESQLQAVRERLDQVKSSKQPVNTFLGFGRIAKPLRGGAPAPQAEVSDTSSLSISSVLEVERVPKENKRTSWLWR